MTHISSRSETCARAAPDRLYPVDELIARFGVKRSSAYALIREGFVRALRVGGRIVIAESEMERFRNALPTYVPNRKVA